MSHFTVLVIGDNVEKQLAPFHEFECAGVDDQYVQNIDITADVQLRIDSGEALAEALSDYGLEDKIIADESEADTVDNDCQHKYGYAVVKDEKLIKVARRTNPDKHWDWYQVGGRWSGFLKLKDGCAGRYGERSWTNADDADDMNYADQATKGDIDFDGMRNRAGAEAALKYDTVRAVIEQHIVGFKSWSHVRDVMFPGDIDAARVAYNEQPVVVAMHDADMYGDPDEFIDNTREQYVQQARDDAITTFAVVKDGKWYERGEMGWFATVSDEKDRGGWNVEFSKLIADLPDDTLLTLVDCHI